jgi:hypothetical protein
MTVHVWLTHTNSLRGLILPIGGTTNTKNPLISFAPFASFSRLPIAATMKAWARANHETLASS